MTLTERAAKVLQQIDEQLALTGKSKWKAVKDEGTGGFYYIEKVAYLLTRKNAESIATANTGYPVALDCLKTAIEGLLYVHQSPFLNATESGEIAQGDADKALAALCDQWEAGK